MAPGKADEQGRDGRAHGADGGGDGERGTGAPGEGEDRTYRGTPEVALEAVLSTQDGRRLAGLRDGPHRTDLAAWWQADFPGEDAEERARIEREERTRARREEQDRARRAAWESFIREKRRELELRRDGQLAGELGKYLPSGQSSSSRRLASEDRRQARESLVALMSGGITHAGIGLRKQGTSSTANDFGIEGMAANSSPGVEQFVGNGTGLNPATTNGIGDGSVNGVLLISATSGFTNCNTAP